MVTLLFLLKVLAAWFLVSVLFACIIGAFLKGGNHDH